MATGAANSEDTDPCNCNIAISVIACLLSLPVCVQSVWYQGKEVPDFFSLKNA